MNMGEELVGDYLQLIQGCEFIQKNLYTEDEQGEVDVVGINLKKKAVYFCEVAIHLVTGLQYTKNGKPNNEDKLFEKFSRDIQYAKDHFQGYTHHFMLWSPIVKGAGEAAKNNQLKDVEKIQERIEKKFNVKVEAVINEVFLSKLNELKDYAANETKEIKSVVTRLYQIEGRTDKHVSKNK